MVTARDSTVSCSSWREITETASNHFKLYCGKSTEPLWNNKSGNGKKTIFGNRYGSQLPRLCQSTRSYVPKAHSRHIKGKNKNHFNSHSINIQIRIFVQVISYIHSCFTKPSPFLI